MNTYDQFRESESRTWPVRAAVVAAALGASIFFSFGEAPIALALAVPAAYAAWFAFLRLFALARCRSTGRIYAMLAGEAALAAFALSVFGPGSAAIALALVLAPYFAHLLGRSGAAFAIVASLAALFAVAPLQGTPDWEMVAALAIGIAATGLLSALIAQNGFRERNAIEAAAEGAEREAGWNRLLQAIAGISSAKGADGVSRALADGMRIATGYPASVLLTYRTSDNAFAPAAVSSSNPNLTADSIRAVSMDDDGVAGMAVKQGAAVSVGEGGVDAAALPEWAAACGYRSGIVAPVSRGMNVTGIVHVLRNDAPAPGVEELERAEMLIGFAARMLAAIPAAAESPPAPAASLGEVLSGIGRASSTGRKEPISLPGMTLDPLTERSVVGGVGVSLSRTEFSMLYALATSAGNVVAPSNLLSECWEDGPAPNSGAIDATVYRLRRKLARAPAGKGIVRTVRGKGYMLVPPSAVAG